MTDAEENLLDWLRDARAMEEQTETLLETQIGRLRHYPRLKDRLQVHLTETRQQSEQIKDCIAACGGDTSALNEFAAKTIAMAQSLSGLFVSDEVVKGCLALHTFKQMEICSYQILVAAAEAVGNRQVAATCQAILQEEEAMAAWLQLEIPDVVRKFLKRDALEGVVAKR